MKIKILFVTCVLAATAFTSFILVQEHANNVTRDNIKLSSFVRKAFANGESSGNSCVQVSSYTYWYEGCQKVEKFTYDCYRGSYSDCMEGDYYKFWNCEETAADIEDLTNPVESCSTSW